MYDSYKIFKKRIPLKLNPYFASDLKEVKSKSKLR